MRIVIWMALVIAACVPASAALITNGDFTVDCSGWTTTNVDGSFCQNGAGGLGAGNPGGFAVLNNGPNILVSMSQTIAGLVVGTQYTLQWDMESAYHCCGSSTIAGAGAAIDGNQYEFIVPNSQNWTHYSKTFTYTGTSNVLTFTAQRNNVDTDAGFDNITLAATGATPEPASLALLGGGLCALALMRRRSS